MKKVWKGAAAVVAALSLGVTGFVGASSAYATVTNSGKVTFNNFMEGDEVTAYRILNIESEANGQFVYSVNPDNKAALVAGLNAVKAEGADDFTTETDNSDLVKAATKLTDDNIEDFAKAFKNAGPTAETTKATTNTLSV